MNGFVERLGSGPPLLLDGPTGTELERQGHDTSGPLWSSRLVEERPDAVRGVHAAYREAGADVLTTVTFRAHRIAFEQADRSRAEWRSTLEAAVRLAREAAADSERKTWIAAGIGPLGDCYRPDAVPPQEVVRAEHRAQAEALAAARPDLLLIETVNTIREAKAATEAAAATGLPVLVSFITVRGGRLLSGEPLQDAVAAVASSVRAVLVNCTTLPAVADAIPHLTASGTVWGAYANGGLGDPREGSIAGSEVDPEAYRAAAGGWLRAGARLVGSCCGTGPQHTQGLRALLDRTSVGTFT